MNCSSSCNCIGKCKNKVFRLKSVSASPICASFIQPPVPVISSTVTTGSIWRNPATETIVVTLLNLTDVPQTVTVSVLDWQSCEQTEMPKEAFLCGENINSLFNGIPIPLTFTIPAKKLLVVHATPQNAWQPGDPCYEVRVTLPPNPFMPGDPCKLNTWGINALGIPQEGNTVLHRQFVFFPVDPV